MFKNSHNLLKYLNKNVLNKDLRCFTKTSILQTSTRPILRQNQERIQPLGWFLLVIPTSAFALGTWQIQRKKWKESLITELQTRTNTDPVALPHNLDEIQQLEYRPVHVRGHFLHDKELYMGPRSLLVKGDASTTSSLMTNKSNQSQGYLVVTPFKLADRDETILVNRGWVPAVHKNQRRRKKGQIEGEVDVVGVVRLHETRPNFSIRNQEGSNLWFYRDLYDMAKVAGTAPIFLDATNDFDVPDGPVGGQTRVSLRNEHLSYVLTWYALCAGTSYMWYKKFLIK